MYTYAWILLGAVGLWLGMPNPVMQLPLAVLAYPASLFLIGRAVAEEMSGRTTPGRKRCVRAFCQGWLCGLAGASACLYWIAIPVHDIGGLPWLLAAPCALILGAYIGLYGGLFAALVCWLSLPAQTAFSTRPARSDQSVRSNRSALVCGPWRRALALGLCWYLLEWIRGWFGTGFPWLSLASAFAPWPVMLQGASVVGVYGLGGVLVGLLALALEDALDGGFARALRDDEPVRRDALKGEDDVKVVKSRPLGLAAAGLALLLCFGFWRIMTVIDAADPKNSAGPVKISLVQGNVDQNVKWDPAMQQATVRGYIGLSQAAVRKERPALLIWPETSMPFDYRNNAKTPFPATLRTFAAETGTALLFGAPGFTPRDAVAAARADSPYETFNRAYLLSPDGLDSGWYEKEHLVPFGEYMPPWLNLPFLRPLLQGVGDFTPGERILPLHPIASGGGGAEGKRLESSLVLGVLICYETIFPELARQRVADGATVLVNISNDAWFGRSSAPRQHLDLGLLRAVEQGRWMARATNTGISAFVDPVGRIVAQGGLFVPESVSHELVPLAGHTPFFHIGPWLPGAALFLFILAVFPVWRSARGTSAGKD